MPPSASALRCKDAGETPAPPPAPPSAASLVQGLAAAAAEVARAAAAAGALQADLSPLLRRGGEGVGAFQALDDLTQHLDGLRRYVEALAQDCPADWRLDVEAAARGLPLHAQRMRLTGAAPDASAPPEPTGELELW